ncbi:piggyBac transposable element-derived protein 4-like [Schistocerca cancellata]|uniref:piggyBac transposable element-derived protein 4-like n=1 Tax=Schistocerca cancellata TaxID=274614 RepID=UPI00211971B7|nr:piggyBac transposable element-derived protein 4-like [Schistocerca cancellata]
MVAFKGRASLKQYMPMKPTKHKFKIWVAACSVTGHMLSFQVYEGKSEFKEDGSLGEKVVLSLSKPFQFLGYCLFLDRFFTKLPLLPKLLTRGMFGCETMLQNRKYFPKMLLKADKQMKLGQHDSVIEDDISITKLKDRGTKSVEIGSNMHNPSEMSQVSGRNKKSEKESIECPKAIADYNSYMGGVDKFEQLMSAYSVSWKSRKWWRKLFYYFLDAAVVNSFILYYDTAKWHSLIKEGHCHI